MKITTVPNGQTGVSIVPAPTDWQALSKTLVIEAAFIGSMIAVLTGHGTPDVVSLAWALGATIGVLRLSDIAANAFNVRTYLNAPGSQSNGVMPQAANTPLVSTGNGGNNNASTPTP